MAKRCDLTGREPSFGHNVSFSKRRTNRRWEPNLHHHRILAGGGGAFCAPAPLGGRPARD